MILNNIFTTKKRKTTKVNQLEELQMHFFSSVNNNEAISRQKKRNTKNSIRIQFELESAMNVRFDYRFFLEFFLTIIFLFFFFGSFQMMLIKDSNVQNKKRMQMKEN
ncbi:hypothetical protein DERF_007140 [Dermatophagoides farinae]|uniref:Transmembrane protein n=1 Tax=Dermatophagoides farinae TaxID=6954 RepID=A0A922L3C3_DERFA|nr:hypothetical protein DERF_007140 [Dermatophagoides farinae]